ncbi:hypothetical protein BRADI_4g04658v3 [Brachypodium distachyon]|uniref:Uncharacterized protein n=1 Tax=Brachypodium distachyon TaxID=15368 RepID=A0A2K2CKF7_BRADI|nr:hypothetical protein BRADI_4g04658v3 [Brachypodium distachyon]
MNAPPAQPLPSNPQPPLMPLSWRCSRHRSPSMLSSSWGSMAAEGGLRSSSMAAVERERERESEWRDEERGRLIGGREGGRIRSAAGGSVHAGSGRGQPPSAALRLLQAQGSRDGGTSGAGRRRRGLAAAGRARAGGEAWRP